MVIIGHKKQAEQAMITLRGEWQSIGVECMLYFLPAFGCCPYQTHVNSAFFNMFLHVFARFRSKTDKEWAKNLP